MRPDELRSLQAPLKDRYRAEPASAVAAMKARGVLDMERLVCRIQRANDTPDAGLHPMAGGDGSFACSGDLLLESLVACAGVTLCAVATAMELPVRGGTVSAEGEMDFRGTLGVDREAPVGFTAVRLHFDLQSDATPEQLDKLLSLTERYCVIAQTLKAPPAVSLSRSE